MGEEVMIATMQEQIKALQEAEKSNRATQNTLHELVSELKVMNAEMCALRKDVEKFRIDIDALQKRPSQRWDDAVKAVVAALIGGLITFGFTQLGLR